MKDKIQNEINDLLSMIINRINIAEKLRTKEDTFLQGELSGSIAMAQDMRDNLLILKDRIQNILTEKK